jgi:hypothetical protein
VVPAEGQCRNFKKNLCWRSTLKNQAQLDKESSIEDAELTAEDVDDLGDFGRYCRTAVKDIEALEGEVSTIEIETEEYTRIS